MLKWIIYYGPAFRVIFDMVTVSIAAAAAVRGLSIVRVVFNAAHTAAKIEQQNARIVELTTERDDLTKSLNAAVAGHDGWKVAIEALGMKMEALRTDMSAQIDALTLKLSISTRYIADLLLFIRGKATLNEECPTIPDELQADLDAYLVKKNGKDH